MRNTDIMKHTIYLLLFISIIKPIYSQNINEHYISGLKSKWELEAKEAGVIFKTKREYNEHWKNRLSFEYMKLRNNYDNFMSKTEIIYDLVVRLYLLLDELYYTNKLLDTKYIGSWINKDKNKFILETHIKPKSFRFTDPSGDISYIPPTQWILKLYPGNKHYSLYCVNKIGNFSPIISISLHKENYKTYYSTQMIEINNENSCSLIENKNIRINNISAYKLSSQIVINGRRMFSVSYYLNLNSIEAIEVNILTDMTKKEKHNELINDFIKTFHILR